MISFNSLGNYGHIGNQMFQYASLKGIAANNKLEYCIPPKEIFGTRYNLRSNIYDCFVLSGLKNTGVLQNVIPYSENKFSFNNGLFNRCIDGIDLIGYFQSHKYFMHIENEIRKDFEFKPNIINKAKKHIDELGKYASLHIRRTDYLNIADSLSTINKEYYLQAISMIPSNIKIVVMSDDIEWCKQQEFLSGERFIFSENNSYIDLYIMTQANYSIIANSTFSWWGAWLNKNNKIVISPKQWFGSLLSKTHNTEDLIPKEWIQI